MLTWLLKLTRRIRAFLIGLDRIGEGERKGGEGSEGKGKEGGSGKIFTAPVAAVIEKESELSDKEHGGIDFKTEFMARSWPNLDSTLKKIVELIAEYVYRRFGVGVVVTETWRAPRHADDLHALWRAVDLRTRTFTMQQANEIRNWANESFIYDPARPTMRVAIFGNNDSHGKHNDHMHIQVSPRTVIKNLHFSGN